MLKVIYNSRFNPQPSHAQRVKIEWRVEIENATKSISAGCNISLYCAGKYNESKKLLIKMPYIDQFTQKKTSEIYKFLG